MKLTSSNFAAAMGISPYQSRQKLWRVMTGREARDPLNAAMQWGIDNEHRGVASVEAHTGLLFEETGKRQNHYTIGSFGTTPDGRCERTGLEIKCPQSLTESVPDHYIPQVQGQIWIAEFDDVIFGQWTYDETRIWRVERCNDYINAMAELLADFCQHLEADTEPKRKKKPVLPDITITRI